MTADGSSQPPTSNVLRVRVTAGSTLLVIGAVVASAVLVNLFEAARRPLAWVLAGSLVAWLLSWIIGLLDRWVPRALATVVTVLGFAVVAGGVWVGVRATIQAEVDRFGDAIPQAARELEQRYEALADFHLVQRAQAVVDHLDDRFGTRAQVTEAAGTASTYVVTGILMLFLVIYGPRFIAGALNQIADPDRREQVAAVLSQGSRNARAYLLLTIAQILAITAVCSLAFWLLELPAPFILGLLVGWFGAIPYFGIILGGLAPLLAAATDPRLAVYVMLVGLLVWLQLVEVLLIRPRVDRATVRVGPAVTLIGAILGFALYGLGGAIYGAAAVVFIWALVQAMPDRSVEPATQETLFPEPPAPRRDGENPPVR